MTSVTGPAASTSTSKHPVVEVVRPIRTDVARIEDPSRRRRAVVSAVGIEVEPFVLSIEAVLE
eukprot:2863181-Prymnesium_polylepis.1